MTTITTPGRITEISFKATTVEIVPLSGGPSGTPTQIEPADADVVVVLATKGGSGSGNWFQLSNDFEIGDVVEFYQMDNLSGLAVKDSSGNTVCTTNTPSGAAIMRRVHNGSAPDWVTINILG